MAKHWSQEMYVLCWSDPGSNGRRRVTVHKDANKLITFAQGMTAEHDPVLYTGFGARKPIPGKPSPGAGKARKQKAGKRKSATAAAPPVAA